MARGPELWDESDWIRPRKSVDTQGLGNKKIKKPYTFAARSLTARAPGRNSSLFTAGAHAGIRSPKATEQFGNEKIDGEIEGSKFVDRIRVKAVTQNWRLEIRW